MYAFTGLLLVLALTYGRAGSTTLVDVDSESDDENSVLDYVTNATLNGGNVTEEMLLEAHREFEGHFQYVMNSILKQAVVYLVQGSGETDVSPSCMASVFRTVFGLKNMESWAYKLFDAMGRPSSGTLRGTVVDFGAYDECLAIRVRTRSGNDEAFRGQYCTAELAMDLPPVPNDEILQKYPDLFMKEGMTGHVADLLQSFPVLTMRAALCVPSECSLKDITKVVTQATKQLGMVPKFVHCETQEGVKVDTVQLTILSLFAVMTCLVAAGTALEAFRSSFYTESKASQAGHLTNFMLCFSLGQNGRRLLPKEGTESDRFSCLHGISTLSIFWIIFSHTYSLYEMTAFRKSMFTLLRPAKRPARFVFESVKRFSSQGVSNYTVAAETFFLITFLPATMATVGVFYLFPFFTSGPIFQEKFDVEKQRCDRHWWTILAQWNNFLQYEDACLQYTWYFNADFQIYALLVPLVMLLASKPLLASWIGLVIWVASIAAVGMQTYLGFYTPTLLLDTRIVPEIYRTFGNIVVRPYTHVGPAIMGVTIWCCLDKLEGLKMKKVLQVLGWLVAITSHFAIMYGTYGWLGGKLPSRTVSAVYAALLRSGWSLGVGWLVLVCVSGHGGIVSDVLSWKAFVPFSKLAASTYLMHVLALSFRSWSIRERIFGHHFVFTTEFAANVVVCFTLGLVLHLLVEAPLTNLAKKAFNFVINQTNEEKQNESTAT
ncbi:nose resistant to fluoxetine protein 6-like [Ornithodoros turicata]|uniref:nose resistant to fluoxetine protein 6-like n=1 Tax=Ornithodoros turicata TaxID=34597 RepID=UPI0031394038